MNRSHLTFAFTLAAVAVSLAVTIQAQPPQFGPPGGPGGGVDLELTDEFDLNEDGWLNRAERAEARKAAASQTGDRRGSGRPGGGRRGVNREPATAGRQVTPDDVKAFPDADLYAPDVVRTLFFEFENEDWEKELEDFRRTDVEVPATLIVDGKKYENVGMRFRGASSYFSVPTGYKRSFNVSVDLADDEQRLYGVKTLNLLNSNGDASFMSSVLYSHIANQYIPAPKANHVHVVINGESWGVYVNVQQFNKDFLKEHFESTKGTRWKVSGSPNGDGGLRYLGEDVEDYKQRYDMKSNDGAKAWAALIQLCRTLNETPLDQLEKELAPLLDVDKTLQFMALDVALVNSDGYWTRASDYSLFLDKDKRFHIIPHDMNEAFQSGRGRGGPGGPGGPGGGGRPGGFGPPPGGFGPPDGFGPPEGAGPGGAGRPEGFQRGGRGGENDERRRERGGDRGEGGDRNRGRGGFGGRRGGPGGGPGHGGVDLDPLVAAENARMPLHSRLLAVPSLRAKYLQYVREIAEKSLNWKNVGPLVAQHAQLIESEVAADTKKLTTTEAFQQATSDQLDAPESGSLRSFFDQRRKFLLEYQE